MVNRSTEVLGADRGAAVCRELTKPDEEVHRGPLAELAEWARSGVHGKVTVVLTGAERAPVDPAELVGEVHARVATGERGDAPLESGTSRRAGIPTHAASRRFSDVSAPLSFAAFHAL